MKFDELLGEIGEFGPYQKRIFVLASLVTVTAGYQVLSVVFLLDIPEHRCALPGYENDTFFPQGPYHESLINLTIPLVENAQRQAVHSKCSLYNVTNRNPGENLTEYECDAWVYDKSTMENTVISEFNMVCKNEIFRTIGTMVGFAGATFGAMIFGVIGDLLGRKKALLAGVLLNAAVGVAASLSPSYLVYTVTLFFFGLTSSALFQITLVIGMEIVGPHKRTLTGMSVEFFWVAGLFLLTALAYLIRRWRILRLVLGVPPFLFIALWWLIPESPRWLLSKGRKEEAKLVVRKIAKSNKVVVEETTLDRLTEDDKEEKHLKFWHMFQSPRLLVRTLIIYFSLFTVSLVYFGLNINVGNLSGNIYLNFFLSSLMELFGYAGMLFLLYKVGRRTVLVTAMLVGGVACLAAIFPVVFGNEDTNWTLRAIALLGKLGASISFAIADIYVVELFPTVVRQSSMAVCNICVSVGGMVAPYIADLGLIVGGELTDALPLIVFGSLSVAAGLLDCLLPETRNRKLPESIEDSLKFGKMTQDRSLKMENKESCKDETTL